MTLKKMGFGIGVFLATLLLIAHVFIIDDYGLTWDFHHHFFAGLHLVKHTISLDLTQNLPFTEPDPRGTYKLPFGPLMSIAPVATYIVFFEKLKLLAFDNAYNLSIILSGVAGIAFLYFFLLESIGLPAAVAGFTFIALFPRYFADLHNNMKDAPQAAAYMLAIWCFWRLVRYQKTRDLFVAALSFALAFNTKVNTLTMPVVGLLWIIVLLITRVGKKLPTPLPPVRSKKMLFILTYFILAPVAAVLLWSLFWEDPIKQLLYIPQFFRDNTQHIEVLYFGKWFCSAVNVPWHYPLGYLAATTPIPMLVAFLVGFMLCVKRIRTNPTASLLLLWFFVPIARYAHPKMGVIDGIRHFEEIVFPLTAIAAVGASSILRAWMRASVSTNAVRSKIAAAAFCIVIAWLVYSVAIFHPYQVSYFNELAGGIRGAFSRFDLDYWGTSQKAAMRWLNENAPVGSKVYVVMAADVAGKYLRPDLRAGLNTTGYDGARYVVVLNRQGFFYRYFYVIEYMLRRKTTHIIENQGVPLVWIFDNDLGKFERGSEWWHGDSPCLRKYWETTPP